MHIIFVPGGPGFSSRPEEVILGPMLERRGLCATFWREPWRDDQTVRVSWSAYVDALAHTLGEQLANDLTVVAHSFAVHPVMAALQKMKRPNCRLVLVSPEFDLTSGHRAIVNLAAIGLSVSQPDVADRMLKAAALSRSFFDTHMQEAFGLAATDSTLFSRYWVDPNAFARFAATLAGKQDGFDMNTFSTLLFELESIKWVLPRLPKPLSGLVVLGAADPIVTVDSTRAQFQSSYGTAVTVFDRCGHWAHLEAPERFVGVLAEG